MCIRDRYSPENFPQRNFGDGGYLNNKPFSYATDTLLRRRANLRTYRKLLYVEPSPEELTGTGSAAKPDAISNVVKALVTLPGYETIRQDIERVHERNRLIERVRSITDDVDRDVRQGAPRPANPATGDRYGNSDLANMIRIKGVAYGGYHRLKVSAVTDELAALIARIAHVEEDSQDFQAIRDLIGAWRRKRYTDFFKSAAPQPSEQSENRFLIDLDLSYRLRRINFLRTKIDELYGLDIEEFREKAQLVCSNPALTTVLDGDQSEIDAFRQELRAIKGSLNATFVYLRRVGRDLRAGRDEGRKLQALVDEAKESIPLKKILGIQTSEGRKKEAENLLKNDAIGSKFDAIASALIAAIRPAAEKAAAECMAALANDSQLVPSVSVARSWIRHYYDYYDDYDMITFPIIYGTDAGEATAVDIIRVSPRDANSLLNEKDPGAPGKLAGATLFHFGGFLDPLWRRNDMLWGRLDGAECIIKMMLPDSEQDATQLVRAAHQAVLDQELAGAAADDPYRAVVLKLRERLGDPRAPAPDIAREHPPDRERMVLNVARATTVVGDVLDNIAQQRGTPGHQAAAWLARAGSLLWGLVEISVPHSWAHLVFRHWLTLLYLFEAFLIIGGLVFNAAAVEKLGLLTLGVTVAFSLGVVLTGEFLRGQRRWLRRLLVVLGLVLLILAAIGAVHLVTLARQAISSFGLGGTI